MIRSFDGHTPQIPSDCFTAENATLIGQVTLEENASVWYGAVLRGDAEPIVIGKNSNVQDNAVLHCDRGFRLTLGKNVTVGHSAVVHGATVEDNVIIGMHATLMNGCVIGENTIIGAGALVKEGQVIPPDSLVVGVPAKVVRQLSEDQRALIRWNADHYSALAQKHKNS